MAELPPPRHEKSDAPARLVGLGLLLMLPVLLAIAFVPLWFFPRSTADQTLPVSLPPYPEPRLQTDTTAAMARFRSSELAALDGVRWTDRPAGLVHVPIAAAMRRVAERGIADWPVK